MERLTDHQLELLLDDLEAFNVERTVSFSKEDKFREAICAFANDLPNSNLLGVLFVGVDDTGLPTGLPITDQLLLTLDQMKTDGNILPIPSLFVEKRYLKGADVAVVTVCPSDMPPVKCKGRIHVRTGPRKSIASQQDERILNEKRRFKNLPFDLSPIPTAKISELSRSVFENDYLPAAFAPDILEANGRSYEEQLSSCKMSVSPTDTTPTLMGILAIGKNPQNFLPGAYIEFLRIDGLELSDPVIDEEKIGGTLAEMLRRGGEKLSAHNRLRINVTSQPTHIKTFLYPPAALQQILYNAVLHRTYESTHAPVRVYWFNDRIEISSPGGPYGIVTRENFGQPGITDYRNPNIGDVLKTFGFVQAFGRGIAIAKSELLKNGHPPLEFVIEPSLIVCILRR